MTNQVAETIQQQFCGNFGLYAIGCKSRIAGENSLTIRFKAKAKNKANFVKIELTPADDYTVTFGRVWGTKVTEISKHKMIYCDMLTDLFEAQTALFLTLHPR